jgi:predicted DNA-binding WGR domain protein
MITCPRCDGVGKVNFGNIAVHCVTIDALTEEKAFDKARQDLIKRKNAKGYIEHGIDAENEPIFIFDSYLL